MCVCLSKTPSAMYTNISASVISWKCSIVLRGERGISHIISNRGEEVYIVRIMNPWTIISNIMHKRLPGNSQKTVHTLSNSLPN